MNADDINEFFSFLHQGRIGQYLFWVQVAAGIITSALLAGIIVVLIKFRELLRPAPPAGKAPIPAEESVPAPWQEVMEKIESANPSDWNFAVIRADSILDAVLKARGFSGETMGDRLKAIDRSFLPSIDDVWEAHKLRNRIAHDADRTLTYAEARRAIILFGNALRQLEYLKKE